MIKICVGNLSYRLTEVELAEAFTRYGEVSSAELATDRFSGEFKGFGFVQMPVQAEAEEAINQLDNALLGGRHITVKQVLPESAEHLRT